MALYNLKTFSFYILLSVWQEWDDHMKQYHMVYCEGYRICKHCAANIGGKALSEGRHLSHSILNCKMVAHLHTHDPKPKPKTKLCPECGEGFSVSHMTSFTWKRLFSDFSQKSKFTKKPQQTWSTQKTGFSFHCDSYLPLFVAFCLNRLKSVAGFCDFGLLRKVHSKKSSLITFSNIIKKFNKNVAK